MDPGTIAPMVVMVTLCVSVAAVMILRGPLGKALARRIEGAPARDVELAQRVEELETRLLSVEQVEGRLMDVEERMDFAERLLAKEGKQVPQVHGRD